MFSIPLLVLSFGIINIHAQECENVKMKMSLTKPGRVELDVDQFCRCAGYSKSTADAPDLSKWKKKPATDTDVDTEKPTKDKTFKVIDEITDILKENTTDKVTERSSTEKDTDTITEKKLVIDKTPITVTTEETKDKAKEKRDEITYKVYRNMTTDSVGKVNEETIVDEDKNFTLVTKKSVAIKDSVKMSTGNVTKEISTALTSDKDNKTDVITNKSPSDSVTESSIDILTVTSVVDKVTDKNSLDMVTDKGSMKSDRSLTTKIITYLVTEKIIVENVTDKITKKFIDKSPIALMMTEKIEKVTSESMSSTTEKVIDLTTEKIVVIIDKSPTDKISDRSFLTSDIITEKSVEYKAGEKNSTDYVIDERLKVTEKDLDVESEKSVVETVIHKNSTEEEIVIIPIALSTEKVTPLTTEKTDTTIDRSAIDRKTESAKDMITLKGVVDKSYEDKAMESSTSLMAEKFADIPSTTEKSVLDTTTDKNSTDNKEEMVTDKAYHRNFTAPTTEKVIKHEEKMENSTEAALGTSHMTKKSGSKLQILWIFLAIMVMAAFIFAVCYTVYMSHKSNSYVLPSPNDEATPLNNI